MRQITLEELLEAGCHFGHQVNRRNPKANSFIFEERSNVHIINLEDTQRGLIKAGEYLSDLAQKGGTIVVVGTKKQAQQIVEENIKRAREINPDNIHFVISRWIGGTLTNFSEISKNFKRLKELQELISSKSTEYTKKEMLLFERELNKLKNLYGGIVDLKSLPDAFYIIDTHNEETAIKEALRMNVPTVGIVDTNADPTLIDYPIPANDDAVGSIELITNYIFDAWIEGSKKFKVESEKLKVEEKKEEEKEKTKKSV